VTATLALLAGLIPAIYSALKLTSTCRRRRVSPANTKISKSSSATWPKTGPHRSVADFDAEYRTTRARLENANAEAYTAPEWCFRHSSCHRFAIRTRARVLPCHLASDQFRSLSSAVAVEIVNRPPLLVSQTRMVPSMK
jgi:hypothetical protein